MEVTYADRQKAKRVIDDLRRDYSVDNVAFSLGINPLYVKYASGMYRHRAKGGEKNSFLCPKACIAKILEYGKLLGMRR